jgi:hypothetical protein
MKARELWQLGDDELLDALRANQTQLNRVYAEQLALLGELSSRSLAMAKGYRSEQRLLQDLLRISHLEAKRRLAHAAAVTPVQPVTGPALPPPLPATADAVRAGVLGAEHVEVIRRVITSLPPDVPSKSASKPNRAPHTRSRCWHQPHPAKDCRNHQRFRQRSPAGVSPLREAGQSERAT